jgi:hypothetical protein
MEVLRAGFIYLHGRTHVVKEFVDKYHSQVCERCLKQGHHATLCRDQARCKFCNESHASANYRGDFQYCMAKGRSCSHTVPVCGACDQKGHIQGSRDCAQYSKSPPAKETPVERSTTS